MTTETTTQAPLSKAATLKLIDKAFTAIEYELDNRDSYNWDKFITEIRQGEKAHRNTWSVGFNGGTKANGLTVAQSVKLFAVRIIVDYLDESQKLDAANFLHIRTDHFYGYAFANEYRAHLLKALKDFDLAVLRALDYAELNKAV